jgi:hypothetical protein
MFQNRGVWYKKNAKFDWVRFLGKNHDFFSVLNIEQALENISNIRLYHKEIVIKLDQRTI